MRAGTTQRPQTPGPLLVHFFLADYLEAILADVSFRPCGYLSNIVPSDLLGLVDARDWQVIYVRRLGSKVILCSSESAEEMAVLGLEHIQIETVIAFSQLTTLGDPDHGRASLWLRLWLWLEAAYRGPAWPSSRDSRERVRPCFGGGRR